MKISAVETYLLQHKLPRAIGPSTMLYPYRETLLVKISTDEGLVGVAPRRVGNVVAKAR